MEVIDESEVIEQPEVTTKPKVTEQPKMDLSNTTWEEIAAKYDDFENLAPMFMDEYPQLNTLPDEEMAKLVENNSALSAMQVLKQDNPLSKAEGQKQEGNNKFKRKLYQDANELYQLAVDALTNEGFDMFKDRKSNLECHDQLEKLYANLSTSEFKLGNQGRSLSNATNLLKKNKNNLKGHYYTIKSLYSLKRFKGCFNAIRRLNESLIDYSDIKQEILTIQDKIKEELDKSMKVFEKVKEEQSEVSEIIKTYKLKYQPNIIDVPRLEGGKDKPKVINGKLYWCIVFMQPQQKYEELYDNAGQDVKLDKILHEMIWKQPPFDSDKLHKHGKVKTYIKKDKKYVEIEPKITFLEVMQGQDIEQVPKVQIIPNSIEFSKLLQ